MSIRGSMGGPPFGVQPGPPDKAMVWNRTGTTRALGDLVMLNLAQTGAETTNNLVGDTASGFANVILATASPALQIGIFCVVTGGQLGDNQLMAVHFSGIIDANVSGINAGVLYEQLAAVAAQDNLDSDVTIAQEKILGILLEVTAAGAEERVAVLFDGWHGFGVL